MALTHRARRQGQDRAAEEIRQGTHVHREVPTLTESLGDAVVILHCACGAQNEGREFGGRRFDWQGWKP